MLVESLVLKITDIFGNLGVGTALRRSLPYCKVLVTSRVKPSLSQPPELYIR